MVEVAADWSEGMMTMPTEAPGTATNLPRDATRGGKAGNEPCGPLEPPEQSEPTLDPREAFKPSSPWWGCMVAPVALVEGDDGSTKR
jgi:hypothetical protein